MFRSLLFGPVDEETESSPQAFQFQRNGTTRVDSGEDSRGPSFGPRRLVIAEMHSRLRLAATEAVAAIDAHRILDPREQVWGDEVADRRGVMHEDPLEAVTLEVEVGIERHDRSQVLRTRVVE